MFQFLVDNIVLVLVAITSGGMLAWPLISKRTMGATVTNEETIEFINKKNAQVIDLRDHKEFKRGAIGSSTNIPFAHFAERMDQVAKDRPVILVDAVNVNSKKASEMLRSKGYTNVYVLADGIKGWVEAKLPFSR